MSDITNYRLFNVPVFMYGMMGLTLGIITLSTLNDDTSNTITSGVFQSSENSSSTGSFMGGKRKTPKQRPSHKLDGKKNKTQKTK